MTYYKYDQNNSGGSFVVDDDVTFTVIVEADSPEEADVIAEGHGVYFDVSADCECCGSRWGMASEYDEVTFPCEVWGEGRVSNGLGSVEVNSIKEYAQALADREYWAVRGGLTDRPAVIVYLKNAPPWRFYCKAPVPA